MNIKVFKKTDFGIISFGNFKGQRWDSVPKQYLEYLITPDCNTSEFNKNIARQELKQRDVLDGQLEFI